MNTKIKSIWQRATILLMLVCLTVPLSATVTGTYNSSTKTLSFTGLGTVTKAIVQSVSGYNEATTVSIAKSVTGIAEDAFTSLTKVNKASIYSPTVAGTTFTSTSNILTRFPYITRLSFGSAVTKIGDFCLYTEAESARSLTVNLTSTPEIGKWTFRCLDLQNSGTLTVKSVSTGSFAFSTLKGIIITDADALAVDAFADCTKLTSVTLPSNLTTITNYSLRGCTSLSSITIPSTVTEIGDKAFWNCTSLNNISLPESLTTLATDAFDGCIALTDLTINSNTIASKEYDLFANLTDQFPYLRNLTYGSSATTVGAFSFFVTTDESYPLETVTFNSPTAVGNSAFDTNGSLTKVSGNVSSVGSYSFYRTNIDAINITGGTSIGTRAFAECSSLASVTLPSTITSIGDRAFENCSSLGSITLPSSLTTIGKRSFAYCKSLKSIVLPSQLSTLATDAFDDCTALTDLTINSNTIASKEYTAVANLADQFPYLRNLTYGSSATTVGGGSFYVATDESYPLKTVTFNSPTAVGSDAFCHNGSLTKVYGNASNVGQNSFSQTNIDAINITGGTSIGLGAFSQCSSLASVTLPSTITSIGNYAFLSCSSLGSITLPSSLTTIGSSSFADCTSLKSIVLPSQLSTLPIDAFSGCTALTDVSIKSPSILGASTYTATSNLGSYFPNMKHLTVNAGASNHIAAHAFQGSKNLTRATIMTGTTSIDTTAFSGCTALDTVYINENTLVSHDYSYNSNLADVFPYLTNLILGSHVTKVGNFCFYVESTESFPLTNVIAANKLEISEFAFCCNRSLESISSPIKSVGYCSFLECAKLTEVTITDDDAIDQAAFQDCSALKDVTLPSTLQEIEKAAFNRCTALKHILCPVATPIPLTSNMLAFQDVPKDCELSVPAASIPAYKAADVWKDFYYGFPSDGYKLTDGTAYTESKNKSYPIIRYTRTFSEKTAGNWQCLYVPFDIHMTDELLEDFDFAELYMASFQDINGDGKNQDNEPLVMVWNKITTGDILYHNTPYFIKAKNAGTYDIEVENECLYAANNDNPLTCSTTKHVYRLQGTNEPYDIQNLYTLNTAGQMTYYDTSTMLKPNRWWMLIYETESRTPIYARTVNIFVDGEDDPTGIVDLKKSIEPTAPISVYTIDGIKVNNIDNLPAGIYIINGKKVAVQ